MIRYVNKGWVLVFGYKDIDVENVFVDTDEQVVIYDFCEKITIKRNFIIWDNVSLKYFFFAKSESTFDINFDVKWNNSDCVCNYLLLSSFSDKIQWNVNNIIKWNQIKFDVNMNSIIWYEWFVDVNWNVRIEKDCQKINTNLSKFTINLYDKWVSNLLPMLEIFSNDVVATHSASIDKIDQDKLFYLCSRWISSDFAYEMLISSYLNLFFSNLWETDLITNSLEYLLKHNEKL